MNLYSDSAQVGFLIGIYFLASAIVALTLVYFSRPKSKAGELKNKIGPVAQADIANEESHLKPAENEAAHCLKLLKRK